MLIAITGNKSGRGIGNRTILKTSSDEFDTIIRDKICEVVESLEHFKVIKIQLVEQWICSKCKNLCTTKMTSDRCSLCRCIGRSMKKVHKLKDATISEIMDSMTGDFTKYIQNQVVELTDKCGQCLRTRQECTCKDGGMFKERRRL